MNIKVTSEFMKQLTFEKNLRSERPKTLWYFALLAFASVIIFFFSMRNNSLTIILN